MIHKFFVAKQMFLGAKAALKGTGLCKNGLKYAEMMTVDSQAERLAHRFEVAVRRDAGLGQPKVFAIRKHDSHPYRKVPSRIKS